MRKQTDREFAIPGFTGEWPWTIPPGFNPRQGISLFFPGNKRVIYSKEDRGKKPIWKAALLLLPASIRIPRPVLVSVLLTDPNFSFPLVTNYHGPLKSFG